MSVLTCCRFDRGRWNTYPITTNEMINTNLLVVIDTKIKRFLVPLSNLVIQRHLAKKASWACIY